MLVTCDNCGKEFNKPPSHIGKHYKACSWRCKGILHTKDQTGKVKGSNNNSIYLREPITGKDVHRAIMERKLDRKLLSTEIVHHKDGNKRNNDEDNLEIVSTATHQQIHVGKVTKEQIYEILTLKKRGHQDAEIGQQFGLSTNHVNAICNGRTWKEVVKQWKAANG